MTGGRTNKRRTNAVNADAFSFAALTSNAPVTSNVNVFHEKGTMLRMKNISIADILELPVQERIRLVELIWDSVAAIPDAVKVSPTLKAELETRLAEFEANPETGYSWDQVKSRLKDGSWRTA
jgi:putative addiction module component (TIGR02574 family)